MRAFDDHADAGCGAIFSSITCAIWLSYAPEFCKRRANMFTTARLCSGRELFRRRYATCALPKNEDMMLAETEKRWPDDHHFVVTDAECAPCQDGIRCLMIARSSKNLSAVCKTRRVLRSLRVRFFADQFDDFTHVARYAFRIHGFFFVENHFFGSCGSRVMSWCIFPGISQRFSSVSWPVTAFHFPCGKIS